MQALVPVKPAVKVCFYYGGNFTPRLSKGGSALLEAVKLYQV